MGYISGRSMTMTMGEKLWRVHWPVLIVISAIAALGTAALYSVAGGSFQPWAERHTLRFLLSVSLVIVMAVVRTEVWLKLAYPVYVIALLALFLVPLLGLDALGARRWIGVGWMSFQPSELMKIALIAALPGFIRSSHPIRSRDRERYFLRSR